MKSPLDEAFKQYHYSVQWEWAGNGVWGGAWNRTEPIGSEWEKSQPDDTWPCGAPVNLRRLRGGQGETRRACGETGTLLLTRCVWPPDTLCCSVFEWWTWRRRRRSTPCRNRLCRRQSSRPERCSSPQHSAFYKSLSKMETKREQ